MNIVADYFRELFRATRDGWNRFWFRAVDPATLGLIRILAGAMLFYTHTVWSRQLEAFFGIHGWQTPNTTAAFGRPFLAWSYFDWISSPTLLWIVHCAALVVFALLTLGLFSRAMAVLAFLITVSYANHVPMAEFGLDHINGLLAMYLAVGPCGAAYSLDRLWQRRRAGHPLAIKPRIDANIAIRLIQVLLCVVYLCAGTGKMTGETWWNGTATWLSIANLEYQSLDATWLVGWPLLANLLTHLTVWWEVSYCVLVWPRLLRPIVLVLAIPIHLGIALYLGMPTFGLVMLIGNVAFISPWLVRRILDRPQREGQGRGVEGTVPVPSAPA